MVKEKTLTDEYYEQLEKYLPQHEIDQIANNIAMVVGDKLTGSLKQLAQYYDEENDKFCIDLSGEQKQKKSKKDDDDEEEHWNGMFDADPAKFVNRFRLIPNPVKESDDFYDMLNDAVSTIVEKINDSLKTHTRAAAIELDAGIPTEGDSNLYVIACVPRKKVKDTANYMERDYFE